MLAFASPKQNFEAMHPPSPYNHHPWYLVRAKHYVLSCELNWTQRCDSKLNSNKKMQRLDVLRFLWLDMKTHISMFSGGGTGMVEQGGQEHYKLHCKFIMPGNIAFSTHD